MFGSNTRLQDGTTAEHGFAALRELDSNQDGVIDSQDAAFSELKIWRDANDNGRTDIGELLSLSEAGIASLQTQWSESTFIDSNGQAHRQTGSVTRLDGSSAAASDVWFSVDARSEEHTSELQSLMRNSYAVFCLKK